MVRLVTALLIVLLVIPGSGITGTVFAQDPSQLGEGDLNCDNFITREHMEAVFAISNDPSDPDIYGLDGPPGAATDGVAGEPCEEDVFSDAQPANCANFVEASRGGRDHAEALLEASDGDPRYNLPIVDGVVCPDDAPPSDLPPSQPAPSPPPSRSVNTGDCDSTLVENGRVTVCAGQYIDVQPFDFAAFAASAQDGFGHFSGSGTSGPISFGVPSGVSSSAPTSGASGITTLQHANEGGNRVLTTAQKAKKKSKAKAKKGKRGKDGKRQRDRVRDRQQRS